MLTLLLAASVNAGALSVSTEVSIRSGDFSLNNGITVSSVKQDGDETSYRFTENNPAYPVVLTRAHQRITIIN